MCCILAIMISRVRFPALAMKKSTGAKDVYKRQDIRNERLARLEHELQQMQPLEGEAHISATQVNEALAQFQDPSLLREAFVRIVLAEDASRRDASVVLARLEQLFQETATAEYVAQYRCV